MDPMSVSYKSGGRMIAMNAPLRLLIQFAYAVHDSPHSQPLRASQVVGGPAWIDSERLRYPGQARGQHRSAGRVADRTIAPRRQIQAIAPPGDERTPCIRSDGEKQWHQTSGGQGSKLRFLSARNDAAEHPWVGRLWLCALDGIAHRAADEWTEAAYGRACKRAGNDTGPAGDG